MVHSIANNVKTEHNELLTKLNRFNLVWNLLFLLVGTFFFYKDFGLDSFNKIIVFCSVISILMYLLIKANWSDSHLVATTFINSVLLLLVFFLFPTVKFEGLSFINLAVLTIVISYKRSEKLIILFVLILLCILSLTAEYHTSNKQEYFQFNLLHYVCLIYFVLDFINKVYIAIRSNNFYFNKLGDSTSLNEQYYSLFKNSFNPILLVDYNQKKILDVNESGAKLFGYSKEDLMHKSTDELILGDFETNRELIDELKSRSILFDINYQGKKIRSETMYKHKDGSIRFCHSHLVRVHGKTGLAYLINYDRTEELKIKRQLEKTHQDYRNIFDNNLLGVNSLDSQSLISKINHSFCEMLGYTEDQLVGKSFLEFVDRGSVNKISELFELLRAGEVQSFIQEINFNREDGHLLQTLLSVSGVYESGELVQSICTVQDISQRKESQTQYSKIFDNSLSGIAIFNDGIILDANDAFANIFQLSLNEINGLSIYELIHPDDLDYLREEIETLKLEEDSLKQVILRAIVSDTEKTILFNIAVNPNLVYNSTDGLMINCIDLTDLMEMQNQLNERQAIYEAVIDNSFTGIDICEVTIDEENNIEAKVLVRNKLMSTYFKDTDTSKPYMTLESLLAISPKSLSNGEDPSKLYMEKVSELIETKKMNFEWSFIFDDEIRDFEIYARMVEVNGKMMIIRNLFDTSERKQKDQIILNQLYENNKKKDELEKYIESNLQLENFAYIASHDLKAPLRTVSSFAFLLKKLSYNELNPKAQKYLDIIISSSSSMQVLIADLLQYARVNSQKVNLKKFDFEPFLNQCIDDMQQDIAEANGQIQFFNLPDFVFGDEVKLAQLFQNLIQNGLKFSRKGVPPLITIDCDSRIDKWRFTVTDNGIGVKDEDKDKIFGIFSKLHSNDEFEGTGLGLTICQKIVEQHNGSIWLDSIFGDGTTFSFTIPKEFQEHSNINDLQSNIMHVSEN